MLNQKDTGQKVQILYLCQNISTSSVFLLTNMHILAILIPLLKFYVFKKENVIAFAFGNLRIYLTQGQQLQPTQALLTFLKDPVSLP